MVSLMQIKVILWGIVVAGNAGAHNYATVVAMRVLLGIFEACVAPGYAAPIEI